MVTYRIKQEVALTQSEGVGLNHSSEWKQIENRY